jgi:hypothetical protein
MYPPKNEQIKKMWYTLYIHYIYVHNGVLFSHKEEQNYVICKEMMDLEIIMLRKVSQTQKDKW